MTPIRTLALLVVLINCAPKNSDSKSNAVEGENFENFFSKFRSDSLFQIERTKFPLPIQTYNDDGDKILIDSIPQRTWTHKKFDYDQELATRETDAYTQEIATFSDSVRIEFRGVDNGIYFDYVFKKMNGNWYLVLTRDFSD